MERIDFFKETTVNNNVEYDHLYNNLSKFVMNYPVTYYRVVQEDVMRPDMISYKNYGTVSYWWIICYVNGVKDPFNDIEVGALYKIPSTVDLYSFYKKYRVT